MKPRQFEAKLDLLLSEFKGIETLEERKDTEIMGMNFSERVTEVVTLAKLGTGFSMESVNHLGSSHVYHFGGSSPISKG